MKLYRLLAIIPALFLYSCDLDRTPNGNNEDFWKTPEGLMLGLNAAYAPFYEEEAYGRGQYWADLSDDMIYNRTRSSEDPLASFTSEVNGSGGLFDNWVHMYQVIRRANDVMKHTPNLSEIQMDNKKRNLVLGEANFLCAYAYFVLAKRYGGLPFYDYNFPDDIYKPRETKTETYKRIVAYLETSVKHFEADNTWKRATTAEEGRPHLGAAYGLLAKVYAHWGQYQKAKEAAEKIINSGKYSLNTTGGNGYQHLFSIAGEKHEEVLFNLSNLAVRNQGTVTSIVQMSSKFTGGTGWYYFAPTKNLRTAFETGDLRREVIMKGAGDLVSYPAYIAMLQKETGVSVTAPVAIRAEDISDMNTGYMGTKFAAPYNDLTSWSWESGADIPLLRYADVLLIHAEAEIFLAGGGPNNRTQGISAAAKSFNEVRVRAFGGNSSKAIASPTFNDLVKERRCELAFEDERHFDLVRWGLAKEVYAALQTDAPRAKRTFDPEKHAHLPIPQREIQNTNNILVNNPTKGYSTFEAE